MSLLQTIVRNAKDYLNTVVFFFQKTGLNEAKAGREFHLSFEITDAEGKRYYKEDDQIIVKIQAPGNFLKKKIEDSVDGTYAVSFTPNIVGPHSVLITVNGKPLGGSPWSVQVSPHEYKHVFTFGSKGSGPGQFNLPHGISIDEDTDCIAVADVGNSRVQIFNADGSYLREFGVNKGNRIEKENVFRSSAAFTKNGDLIVLSAGKISLFSASGQFIKHITNMHLKDACRLSVAPDGNIIVYDDADNNIKVLSPDGTELLQSFSADTPNDIIYHQEKFFTSYYFPYCVKVYNREGVFEYDIGSEGSDDGQLSYPAGLAIDKFNNLIVCDFAFGRPHVFTLDGQFLNTISGTLTKRHHSRAVAVSKTGRVYITDPVKCCVYMFQ